MQNLDYGVIGNCKSAALISKYGNIEWLCLPDFNSSSVFGSLLDKEKGGCFHFIVSEKAKVSQKYIEQTNILVTNFKTTDFEFEVVDFMPRYRTDEGFYYAPPDLIRYIIPIKGKPRFKVVYNPQLNYALNKTVVSMHEGYIKHHTASGKYESVYLYTDLDQQAVIDSSEIEIERSAFFLLSYNQKIREQNFERIYLKFERTKVYWLNWADRTIQLKEYDEEVTRSALVLKMLSFQPTGAILAAVTTSLPESIGEERNWDYRFCWIRDAAMMIRMFYAIGHPEEALRFLNFIIDIIPAKDEKIQIMYGIRGEKMLTEKILDHLDGYKGSKPVRIGNAAYKQKQHDIYGVLMDVIYQNFMVFKVTNENSEELWTIARSIVRSVQRNWKNPDRGIWEIRTDGRHFTFSKVLCWVAADRGMKIAEILGKKNHYEEYRELRAQIADDIYEKAWNDKLQAYTQYYGSEDMDASLLLMETYGFIDAHDKRFRLTVNAIKRELLNNGLMYRYKNKDDFGEPSSSFTICNFWLVTSLVRLGEKEEAKAFFDKLLSYSNHVGLFSEDLDFNSRELLGNFPQGYSHLALIESAIALSEKKTSDFKLKQFIESGDEPDKDA